MSVVCLFCFDVPRRTGQSFPSSVMKGILPSPAQGVAARFNGSIPSTSLRGGYSRFGPLAAEAARMVEVQTRYGSPVWDVISQTPHD